jgi:periplasmic divalent cation tolerance protein
MTEMLMVFTSFASEDDAARVVRTLVEERLAACGNLLPARSIYAWKGKIEDQRETVAILKTRKQDWTALLSRLHELHSYEVPECVAVRIAAGAPKYMAWLEDTLSAGGA